MSLRFEDDEGRSCMTLSRPIIFRLFSESSCSFYMCTQSFIYLCLIQLSSRNDTKLKTRMEVLEREQGKESQVCHTIGSRFATRFFDPNPTGDGLRPLFQMCLLICTCFGKQASTVAFASLHLFGCWLLTMVAWDNIDEDCHVGAIWLLQHWGPTSFRAECDAKVPKVMIPYPRFSFGGFGRM